MWNTKDTPQPHAQISHLLDLWQPGPISPDFDDRLRQELGELVRVRTSRASSSDERDGNVIEDERETLAAPNRD